MASSQPGLVVLEFRALKRTQRYGAKVKTGCSTCKSRRVRCDEQKPACQRCTKSGWECRYGPSIASWKSARRPGKFLMSRMSNPMLAQAGGHTQHLEYFYHCAKSTLSGIFEDEFWSRITLQLAQSEPAIRHALMALGYLTKTKPGSLKHALLTSTDICKDGVLTYQYNRALASVVARVSDPSYEPGMGLVACLLFVCIEFFKADYHRAFMLLNSGLRILEEVRTSGVRLPASLVAMIHRTMTHAITVGLSVPGIFDVSITGPQLYPKQTFGAYCIHIPSPQDYPEQGFATISDAHESFTPLLNSSILFTREWGQKLFLRIPVTQAALQAQQQILSCLDSWRKSFRLLKQRGRWTNQDRNLMSALMVQYHPVYISTCFALEKDQWRYDAHLASFKAINHHARIVLRSMGLDPSSTCTLPIRPSPASQAAANFTFKLSLIPSLFYVASRCRCPVTRREAVALLELNPPREALWDAEQQAVLAKRIIEIEESCVDVNTGWPLQSSRIFGAALAGDMDDDGGFMVAFSYDEWAKTHSMAFNRRRPFDSQWVERLVI